MAWLLASTAVADPAPRPVKVEALKSTPIVLTDAEGGIYVVFGDGSETSSSTGFSAVSRPQRDVSRSDDGRLPRLFYGPNAKAVHDQGAIACSSAGRAR